MLFAPVWQHFFGMDVRAWKFPQGRFWYGMTRRTGTLMSLRYEGPEVRRGWHRARASFYPAL